MTIWATILMAKMISIIINLYITVHVEFILFPRRNWYQCCLKLVLRLTRFS